MKGRSNVSSGRVFTSEVHFNEVWNLPYFAMEGYSPLHVRDWEYSIRRYELVHVG